MTIIYIIAPLLLFAAIFYYTMYMPSAQKDWERLPTLDEYLAKNPTAKHGEKISCSKCGHTEQLDTGLIRISDFRRKLMCTKCKKTLWREEEK
ncbi:hypothetical protein [Iodobacter violaceini]|nr:hypothetical protein [Iodobacter violacea]